MFVEYRMLSDLERVPRDSGGLYFFRLRFPSDFELGLNWSVDETRDVKRVVSISKEYFQKATELATPSELHGDIFEVQKALHLQSRFTISAIRNSYNESIVLLEETLFAAADSDQKLKAALRAIRVFFAQLPIAYVGMASRQSLYDRLLQHINDSTGFSERIRLRGLGWNDFLYFAMRLPEFSSTDTRGLEKLFQSISRPAFSLT